MCGICGEISLGDKLDYTEVSTIQKCLQHRGPDGSGRHRSLNVDLAMRRLAIIDVKGGDQPLYNEDKSIEVIGNGEIFNYLELQKDLIEKGHKLRTGSDIETIAHLYEEYGEMCVKKLRGQFAIALHDTKTHKVFLYRDRLGEKPLYYTQVNKRLVFSSEMKSLLQIQNLDKTVNLDSVYLYFNYYFIPEPQTMFKYVQKLPPGHMLVTELTTHKISLKKYWDAKDIKAKNLSDPTAKIKSVFSQACEITMRSDVPVGIALSGGVDSGAILSLCAPKYKKTMKAFSVGYEGTPDSDERKMARDLAKKFRVKFIETEIKNQEMVNYFPQLVWDSDDPIADIAAYPIYRLSKLARANKVPVILGGIGGDELFWGYPSTIDAVKNKIGYNNPNPSATGRFFEDLYTAKFKTQVAKIIQKPLSAKNQLSELRDKWLVSNCIALNDRLSMASSIELRSPFLDYKLVETVLSSKKAIDAYGLPPKYYLKKALKGILPEEIMQRPKKGFTPPVSKWLYGLINKYCHTLRNGFLVQNKIINWLKVEILIRTWQARPANWYSIYQLILLEIWGREFIWNEQPKKI